MSGSNSKVPQSIQQKPVFLRLRRLATILEQRDIIEGQSARADLLDAALTTCVELLEGIANVIIWSTPQLNESLQKDGLERLSPIEKFDLMHTLKTYKPMDLGHHTVARLKQLIKNRVNLIHPKPVLSKFASIKYGDPVEFKPKESLFISTEEDIKLVKNLFYFLDTYFIDWCKIEKNLIFQLVLANEVHFSDGSIGLLQPLELVAIKTKLQNLLKIEIRFLG